MSLPIFNFGDVHRHTFFIGFLYSRYLQKYEDDNILKTHIPFKDNTTLCFKGNRRGVSHLARLYSSTEFETYPENLDLNTIEPDFMLFRNNKFLRNENHTRLIGQPDLVVEIWSKSNELDERNFKRHLYFTSDVTEHWYLEQNSNIVECFVGENQINSQSLTEILVTQNGIEFDLRRLAL